MWAIIPGPKWPWSPIPIIDVFRFASVNAGPLVFTSVCGITSLITVVNNDVMPHTLVKTSGPALTLANLKTSMMGMGLHGHFGPGMMAHMGAAVKISFAHSGVYHFTTRAGE